MVPTISAVIYLLKEFPHLTAVQDAGSGTDSIRNTSLSLINPQKWGARGNMPDWCRRTEPGCRQPGKAFSFLEFFGS